MKINQIIWKLDKIGLFAICFSYELIWDFQLMPEKEFSITMVINLNRSPLKGDVRNNHKFQQLKQCIHWFNLHPNNSYSCPITDNLPLSSLRQSFSEHDTWFISFNILKLNISSYKKYSHNSASKYYYFNSRFKEIMTETLNRRQKRLHMAGPSHGCSFVLHPFTAMSPYSPCLFYSVRSLNSSIRHSAGQALCHWATPPQLSILTHTRTMCFPDMSCPCLHVIKNRSGQGHGGRDNVLQSRVSEVKRSSCLQGCIPLGQLVDY